MTDVHVIGFGVAGASAAIAAHDGGATVTISERTAKGGGNAVYAGGFLLEADLERLEALCFGMTPTDVLAAYADGMAELDDWLKLDFQPAPFPPSWPHLPGTATVHRVRGLFDYLHDEVVKRGIEVRYDTRVTELDERPTILACGGFEYDEEFRTAFLTLPVVPVGHPGNTGDAIRLARGASLWHMSAFFGWYAFRHPDHAAAFPLDVHAPSFVHLDADGRRFTDEQAWEVHDRLRALTVYDPRNPNRPALPGLLVFDERARLAGPLNGIVGTPNDYAWSNDNAREIEAGWIKAYDAQEFEGLEPPLWAIETWPAVATASGGPRRNAKAQVVQPDGTPIPNLFAAGGAGSVWGHLTDHGGGLTDALVFGRVAGNEAAK